MSPLGANFSGIVGEDPLRQVPQGKLHSPIVKSNGWIYFATHLANYWIAAQNAYTGSHIIGYRLGSLEGGRPVFRDLGIPIPRYTTYSALAVDPAGEYLWSLSVPFAGADAARDGSHLIRTHIATGRMRDYGPVVPGRNGSHAGLAMHVDSRGDAWITLAGGLDKLYVARAESGRIDSFDHALPTMSHLFTRGAVSSYQGGSWWPWGQSIDGERFLFTMADATAPYEVSSGGSLWEFDASKTRDGDVRDAFREVAWIGGTTLGITYDGAGTVYFVRRNDGWHHPKISAVQGNGEYWDAALDDHVRLNLYSVNITGTPSVVDWGFITDREGRVPWRIESVSADATTGQVYMTGDWVMKASDPVAWRTLRDDGPPNGSTLHIRGQAFLVAHPSARTASPAPSRRLR